MQDKGRELQKKAQRREVQGKHGGQNQFQTFIDEEKNVNLGAYWYYTLYITGIIHCIYCWDILKVCQSVE